MKKLSEVSASTPVQIGFVITIVLIGAGALIDYTKRTTSADLRITKLEEYLAHRREYAETRDKQVVKDIGDIKVGIAEIKGELRQLVRGNRKHAWRELQPPPWLRSVSNRNFSLEDKGG